MHVSATSPPPLLPPSPQILPHPHCPLRIYMLLQRGRVSLPFMRAAWYDIRTVFPEMSSRGHNLQDRPAHFPRLTLHISLKYFTKENP